MMVRRALPLLSAAILVASGCGDDPVQAEPFDLAGEWTYSATSLTGILPENTDAFPGQKISVTCAVSPTPMVLSGSNAAFAGSFSSATVICELLDKVGGLVDTEVLGPVDGTVDDGTVIGGATEFDFDAATGPIAAWSNEGNVDGGTALGSVQMQATVAGETVQLRGRWVASRN